MVRALMPFSSRMLANVRAVSFGNGMLQPPVRTLREAACMSREGRAVCAPAPAAVNGPRGTLTVRIGAPRLRAPHLHREVPLAWIRTVSPADADATLRPFYERAAAASSRGAVSALWQSLSLD